MNDLAACPVGTLVSDYAAGPGSESCGIVEPVDPSDDCQPGLLNDVAYGIAFCGEAPCEPTETRVVSGNECLEGIGVAVLALEYQQFVVNVFVRSVHWSGKHSRAIGEAVQWFREKKAICGEYQAMGGVDGCRSRVGAYAGQDPVWSRQASEETR